MRGFTIFNREALEKNIRGMIGVYNAEVDRWHRRGDMRVNVSDFVSYDESRIKWDRELRQHLQRGKYAEWTENKVEKFRLSSVHKIQPIF